ncbi:putative protein N(5)-glutamine methyltransferase [Paenarthrobacter sp. NPDC089675]|uniref:putative protein N(5)-glutamine methyltransferase n=1 Tax=Paenarthrobacter sp. NPDC089675 TaxID=3364376 RepID=UPI003820FC5B
MSPDSAIVHALRAAGCVFAEEEAALLMEAAGSLEELDVMVRRRAGGLPLEHLLGWVEFCGTRMAIEPGVFVPRRRTEFLVEQAARMMAERGNPAAVVVDLCCGSGAIGAALSDVLSGCELYAADIDPVAVKCARRNIEPRGGQVFQGDLFEPLPRGLMGRVDVLLVNAPYVPTDAISMMPPEARLHEPLAALDGGADGLDVQRRVAMDSTEWLALNGVLLIETSKVQASTTAGLLARAGLTADVVTDADLDATLVIGSPRDH